MAKEAGIDVKAVDPERKSFWGNTTTTGIVAGVLLAIVMVLGEQVAERLDTMLFGGVVVPIGIAIHMACNMTAVVTYGFVSALIVANLNPMISVATATGPMAPLWFATNSGSSLGGRLVHYYGIKKDIREMSYLETFWVTLGGMVINALIMVPIQLWIFNIPIGTVAWFKIVELLAGTILPALVAWKAGPALKRIRN